MDLQELRQEAIKIIKANPELKSEIQDLFSLAISEVEEGGSESHECDLAYNDMIELQNEANNNKMVKGGNLDSKSLFDLEYGDIFKIDRNPERPHTMTGQHFLFIGFSEKYAKPEGVTIEAAYFPGSFYGPEYDQYKEHSYLSGLKNGDITIISKEEAGEMLLDYYIRNDKFKNGGKLTVTQQAKFDKVMSEWKAGKLHSGSSNGPIVKDQDQAIAIAYAQANGMKKMEFGGLVYDSLSNEAKDRMDGLVPTEQINNVLSNCRYIVSQMMEEGFELDEAISFIVYKIVDDFTDKRMGYFSDEYYPEDWKETGGSVEDNQIEEYAEAIYEDLRQEYKPYELQNMSMEEAMMSVDSYDEVPENLKEEVASYLMNMASQNEFFEEDEEDEEYKDGGSMYNKGGVIENKMQSLENELKGLESEIKWTQQQNGASKQYYLRKRRSGKMTRERAMELIDQSNASWKKEREKVREKIKEVKDRIKRLEELSSKVTADQFADGGGIGEVIYQDKTIKVIKPFRGEPEEYKEFKVIANGETYYCDVFVNGTAPEKYENRLERVFRKLYPKIWKEYDEDYAYGGKMETGGAVDDDDVYFATIINKKDPNYNRLAYSKSAENTKDKDGNEFDKLYFENKKTPLKYNVKDLNYNVRKIHDFKDVQGRKFMLLKELQKDKTLYYYIVHSGDKKVYTESGNMNAIKEYLKNLTNGKDFYSKPGINFADGGGVDKLPANLKKRLDKANSIIVKYNGKPISEAEAIRFNADQMPQSGYNGGLKAFRFSNAKGFENATKRDYQTIGDALIDISRKMSGKDIYADGGGVAGDQ